MTRLAAALALAAAPRAWSQSGGPYAPVVLQLPAGARSLAMGNAGIGGRDDDVLFFNPAQVAIARGMSASAERYSASASGGSVSAVTRLASGGIAIGVRMADYDASPNALPVDRGSMLSGTGVIGTSLEATAGIAQVVKGIRVGAAAKYVEDAVPSFRANGAALDVGASKDVFRYFTAGLAVQNIGSSMTVPCSLSTHCVFPPITPSTTPGPITTTAVLPLRTTLGIAGAGPVGPFDLTATAAVSMLRASWLSPAAGIEASYSWLDGYAIAVRAGGRRPLAGEGPITAGAGFTMDRLSIDYALETLAGGRVGHRIGLRIR